MYWAKEKKEKESIELISVGKSVNKTKTPSCSAATILNTQMFPSWINFNFCEEDRLFSEIFEDVGLLAIRWKS